QSLLGDRVTDVVARQQSLRVDHFDTPAHFRDYFKTHYGPTIAVYRSIAGEPGKVEALDQDLVALAQRFDVGVGTTVLDWEYLLVTASKRS
ncbi:MAG TPA: SAM-dependent methyltransferase, partial [Candidatus Lustribacter sp.]|nr:SAM-dependent methyltransferase [Candidatus Lustribacter sp.]